MGMIDSAISAGGFALQKAFGAPVLSDAAQMFDAGVDMSQNGLTNANESSMIGGAGKAAIDLARASSKAVLPSTAPLEPARRP